MKGSFTGADKDHTGLVERADGGILFLDEIHRLTAEGQEKMFLLMDNGIFRRLGETGAYRHAQVLIVGATTEDAQRIMLNTFLRRIPVHIQLPELEKRSIRERLELVLYFIWRESQNIRNRIFLDTETLRMLVHYKCPANVGQLASDIKLTCANAYYDFKTGRRNIVGIHPSHLSARVSEGLFVLSDSGDSSLVRQQLRAPGEMLDISGQWPIQKLYAQYIRTAL
jgi:transcriptional regulator with AAA-type ATPase domain